MFASGIFDFYITRTTSLNLAKDYDGPQPQSGPHVWLLELVVRFAFPVLAFAMVVLLILALISPIISLPVMLVLVKFDLALFSLSLPLVILFTVYPLIAIVIDLVVIAVKLILFIPYVIIASLLESISRPELTYASRDDKPSLNLDFQRSTREFHPCFKNHYEPPQTVSVKDDSHAKIEVKQHIELGRQGRTANVRVRVAIDMQMEPPVFSKSPAGDGYSTERFFNPAPTLNFDNSFSELNYSFSTNVKFGSS